MSWEAVALVAIGGVTVGAVVVLMLLGRRPPQTEQFKLSLPRLEEPPAEPDPFFASANLSRRTTPRRGGRLVDVLISDATNEAEPFQGWVIDRSAGGLALGTAKSFPVGTILSVRPLAGADHAPWVQIEILNSSEVDGGNWRLGCKFVRPPAYSTLMLFG